MFLDDANTAAVDAFTSFSLFTPMANPYLRYLYISESNTLMKATALIAAFVGSTTAIPFAKRSSSGAKPKLQDYTSCANDDVDDDQLLADELSRCGNGIIDPHLHIAPWFNDATALVNELEATMYRSDCYTIHTQRFHWTLMLIPTFTKSQRQAMAKYLCSHLSTQPMITGKNIESMK